MLCHPLLHFTNFHTRYMPPLFTTVCFCKILNSTPQLITYLPQASSGMRVTPILVSYTVMIMTLPTKALNDASRLGQSIEGFSPTLLTNCRYSPPYHSSPIPHVPTPFLQEVYKFYSSWTSQFTFWKHLPPNFTPLPPIIDP